MYLHIFAEVPTLSEVARYTPVLPSQNVPSQLHVIISIFVIKFATPLSVRILFACTSQAAKLGYNYYRKYLKYRIAEP